MVLLVTEPPIVRVRIPKDAYVITPRTPLTFHLGFVVAQ